MGSRSFDPQSVPPNTWKHWLLEALSLITKKWHLHTAVVLGTVLLVGALPDAIRLLLTPMTAAILVGTTAAIAQSTYKKTSTLAGLRAGIRGLVRLALLVAVYQGLFMGLLGIGGTMVSKFAADVKIDAASDFVAGHWALFGLMICWAGSKREDFFLIPLMVCGHLGWIEGGRMSQLGVKRNGFVFLINLGATCVCGLAMAVSGVLAAPLLPLSGALLYVAYRHVFLMDAPKEEAPQRSKTSPHELVQAD